MSLINPLWARRIIRAVAIMNILFGGYGGYLAGRGAKGILARVLNSPAKPWVHEAYCVMTLVDLCCLLMLAVGGVFLLQLNRVGLRICNLAFVMEIAWFLGTSWVPLALAMSRGRWALLGQSIAAAGGIGSLGTAPQFIIGYPVLALVILNLARGGFRNSALHA
jgi:hypothetical protein